MEFILTAIVATMAVLSLLIGFYLGKKMLFKMPVIVINRRNKTVLKDRQFYPAYWKMLFWSLLPVFSLTVAIPLCLFEPGRSIWQYVLGIGAAVAIFAVIMWRKRRADFYKAIKEAGVVLETDAEAAKAAFESARKSNFKWMIGVAVLFFVVAVVNFVGESYVPAALYVVGGVLCLVSGFYRGK
ncbi:MAG: hypothetical protein FWH20_11290 [Oscillospiraceae bacterium]|nr:hypothetical protein [Oscillospiraceae bacterium]